LKLFKKQKAEDKGAGIQQQTALGVIFLLEMKNAPLKTMLRKKAVLKAR